MLDTPDERRFDTITALLKEMFQVRGGMSGGTGILRAVGGMRCYAHYWRLRAVAEHLRRLAGCAAWGGAPCPHRCM